MNIAYEGMVGRESYRDHIGFRIGGILLSDVHKDLLGYAAKKYYKDLCGIDTEVEFGSDIGNGGALDTLIVLNFSVPVEFLPVDSFEFGIIYGITLMQSIDIEAKIQSE